MEENNINNETNPQQENISQQENIINENNNNEKVEDMVNPILPPKKTNKTNLILIIICLVLSCCAFIFSCLNFFSNKGDKSIGKAPKVIQKGDLRVAYVNTDTVLAKYTMAKDMEKSLKAKQTQMESSLKQKAMTLQNDYQNYLKNGSKLTLTQQKEKEKELTQRQQALPGLQQQMMAQLQEEQLKENKKLLDAVYAFIKDYNSKHDKYNIILSRSYSNSPTLYMDEGMEITDEIVKGLNEEYKEYKKK